LARRNLTTIGQLAGLSDGALYELFGRSGKDVRELARGNDARGVSHDRETRSVSSEETFEIDIRDGATLRRIAGELSADVARRLETHGLRGTTIGIKLKRADFSVHGRQTSLAVATSDVAAIEAAALHCLERVHVEGEAVRLLGVRVAGITEEPARQISLFASLPAQEP
jgi:DNA polymerase-4